MNDWMTSLNSLLGCPACGFDPNDTVTQAANSAIGFMIVILFGILGAIIAFMVKLAKGERAAREELEKN
ncbi:MAG: hypothetical protein ACI8UO_003326 [Verrucomicrobiales bacterium]|jgi:hypothetical protein